MFSSVRSSRVPPGFSSDAWVLLKGPGRSTRPFTQPSAQESKAKPRAVRKTLLCHLSWAHSLGAVTSSLDHSVPLTLGAPAQRMHDLELAWGRSPWILHLDSINEIKNSSESIVCKNSLQTIQSLSTVWIFVTPWITAHKASLSITNCQSLPKLMSIKSVMPSNHFILCRPLLLPPSIFPTIRVFSNDSVLCIKWPKYWSFTFSISLSKENSGLTSFRIEWLDLLAVQRTHKNLLQHHGSKASIRRCSAFFTVQLWHPYLSLD